MTISSTNSPASLTAQAPETAAYDLTDLTGTIVGAKMDRSGVITTATGFAADM
jgi:hypothetical protein